MICFVLTRKVVSGIYGDKEKLDSIPTEREIRTVLSLMQKKLTDQKEEYRKEGEFYEKYKIYKTNSQRL